MAEVDISELQPNSHKSHEERRVEKVVTTKKIRKRKKTPGQKMEEAMLGDDPASVKSYLIWDVLLPAVKDTISEMVKKGIDALLFGDERKPDRVRRDGNRSYYHYDNPSYYSQPAKRSKSRVRNRRMHRFDDIFIEDRAEAERVLDTLVDLTMQYGLATVSDFYDLVGLDHTYVDGEYGWYELSDAEVRRTRDGFIVDLPRPERIEDDW